MPKVTFKAMRRYSGTESASFTLDIPDYAGSRTAEYLADDYADKLPESAWQDDGKTDRHNLSIKVDRQATQDAQGTKPEDDEFRILTVLVRDIVAGGYAISVIDGYDREGTTVLEHSRDAPAIVGALRSTDGDTLKIYSLAGGVSVAPRYVGAINLVYGNSPWEVIADYTDNEESRTLVAGADKLASELEAAADAKEAAAL